ncbi:DUF4112 domain-containing protein [Stratiformator vulcanicus]|nr:DUF4112 domain-containing protein [Stratiformator vulcanicus]
MSQENEQAKQRSDERRLGRMKTIARLMDDAVGIPGTNHRIGWDGLIGLIPFGGDVVTCVIALWLVYDAFKLGASSGTLSRMIANVTLDLIVGLVPALGDVLDFVFKANRRNMELLEADLERQAAESGGNGVINGDAEVLKTERIDRDG